MSRRHRAEKREVIPDAKFGDVEPLKAVLERLRRNEPYSHEYPGVQQE